MTESGTIETIIQGGAVGLSVLLILYSGWKDKIFNKTLNNHLEHFTIAMERNSEIIGKNAIIQESICRLLERVEKRLDK